MAMNLTERRAEIDRLVKSALEDLDALSESLMETIGAESGLNSADARMLARARDDLARAKVLIEAAKGS